MKTSFRVVFLITVFVMCFLTQACVGMVRYNEMRLQTEINAPSVLNLRNYGNTHIAFFKQSENLVREHLIKNDDKEYGYYVVKYKAKRADDYKTFVHLNSYFLFTTVLFGVPTYSSDFDLIAYLYIFDSQGKLVKEYKEYDSYKHLAGLYYGHKPTKKMAKRYSKMYGKIFQQVAQQAEEINNALLKTGAINNENTKKAKANIKAFFEKK